MPSGIADPKEHAAHKGRKHDRTSMTQQYPDWNDCAKKISGYLLVRKQIVDQQRLPVRRGALLLRSCCVLGAAIDIYEYTPTPKSAVCHLSYCWQ